MDHPKRPDNFTGIWIDCHGTNARTEQHYVNGVANGPYRSILENGVVHREGYRKDGLWHGTLIVRNSRGEVLDTSEFVDGTGVYRIFNSEGRMTDEVPMLHGKPHGIVRCWRRDEFVMMCYYDHGVCGRGGRRSIASRWNAPARRKARPRGGSSICAVMSRGSTLRQGLLRRDRDREGV